MAAGSVTLSASIVLFVIGLYMGRSGRGTTGHAIIWALFGISLGGTTWAVAGDAINAAILQIAIDVFNGISGAFHKK